MSRLLYTLEDYFDALADQRKGRVSGWTSRLVSNLFAVCGDLLRAEFELRRARALKARSVLPVS